VLSAGPGSREGGGGKEEKRIGFIRKKKKPVPNQAAYLPLRSRPDNGAVVGRSIEEGRGKKGGKRKSPR